MITFVCGGDACGKTTVARSIAWSHDTWRDWKPSSYVWGKHVDWMKYGPTLFPAASSYADWWAARLDHRAMWIRAADDLCADDALALVKLHASAGHRVYDGVRQRETLVMAFAEMRFSQYWPALGFWVGPPQAPGVDFGWMDMAALFSEFETPCWRIA